MQYRTIMMLKQYENRLAALSSVVPPNKRSRGFKIDLTTQGQRVMLNTSEVNATVK